MDVKAATAPAGDGSATALHVPAAHASAADSAMLHAPFEQAHSWSALAAILLIVVAVAWSLLRQRRGRPGKG